MKLLKNIPFLPISIFPGKSNFENLFNICKSEYIFLIPMCQLSAHWCNSERLFQKRTISVSHPVRFSLSSNAPSQIFKKHLKSANRWDEMARAEIGLSERPSKLNQPLTYPKITLLVYILHLLVCFSYSTHRNSISTGVLPGYYRS